jgi:hypothetical protein
MRQAIRATTAFVLAVPLFVAAVPASAASQTLFKDRGSYVEVFFEGELDSADIPGNYAYGALFVREGFVDGFLDAFECAEGETPSEGECDYLGSYYGFGDDVTVTSGKGKNATTSLSGSFDLYEFTEEGDELVTEDVPFDVTLTPTGATSRATFSEVIRDPENGYTYRVRETRATQFAAASGSVDGVTFDGADGAVGTYRVHVIERVA